MINEETTLQIDQAEFEKLFTPEIKKVIETVRQYGFDIRVVGGAVRDFIIGKTPRDIDFATDADPSELIYIYQLEGIDYDAKGIGHGTVKAKFGDETIDVTSISYKIGMNGKDVYVKRGMDWEKDAESRDLTINSMSLDSNGVIHDYVDGMVDLKKQIIRFNPGIADQFEDDPHLIMRWFKTLSVFDNPVWFKTDFKKIQNDMQFLAKIKGENKTERELTAIMRGNNARTVLKMMCKMGANKYLDLTC